MPPAVGEGKNALDQPIDMQSCACAGATRSWNSIDSQITHLGEGLSCAVVVGLNLVELLFYPTDCVLRNVSSFRRALDLSQCEFLGFLELQVTSRLASSGATRPAEDSAQDIGSQHPYQGEASTADLIM